MQIHFPVFLIRIQNKLSANSPNKKQISRTQVLLSPLKLLLNDNSTINNVVRMILFLLRLKILEVDKG